MTVASNLELTAKWLTVAPDTSSFRIEGIQLRTTHDNYDPKVAVPTTEDILISGYIAPWFLTWNYRLSYGKLKLTDLEIFYAANVSFSAVNADGEQGFSDNSYDVGCSVSTEIYGDRTVFRSDDGKVVVTVYGDETKADTIVIDGSSVPLINNAAAASVSRYFEATVSSNKEAANGRYKISYTISAEREEDIEW
jgi:hypothetical protein